MPTWKVKKYRGANGRCPIDEWRDSKALTVKDQARMDALLETIEQVERIPPETVKKYETTQLYEVKIRGDRKQLRPLAVKRGKTMELILLSGAIEKGGSIPKGDIKRADNIRNNLEKGLGSVEEYF
jgi:predicted type IV restriction endonuclease